MGGKPPPLARDNKAQQLRSPLVNKSPQPRSHASKRDQQDQAHRAGMRAGLDKAPKPARPAKPTHGDTPADDPLFDTENDTLPLPGL